jgi:hypothetical protein
MHHTARAQDLTVAAAALAIAGLAGCSALQPAGGASASPVATSVPSSPSAVASPVPGQGETGVRRSLLTQADTGLTLLLPVGAEITVVLTPAVHGLAWDQPTAQGSDVTRVSAGGGYPSTRPARAVFRAVAPGNFQLMSSTDLPCSHQTPPCPVPVQKWWVAVVVPALPSVLQPAGP